MKLKSLYLPLKKRFNLVLFVFFLSIVLSSVAITLFVMSPYFASKVKGYISVSLTKILHKEFAVQTLRVSIFAPQIVMRGVSINGVAYAEKINLFFGPLNFFKREITIDKIGIIHADFNVFIKNHRIDNYKTINSAIKSLIKASDSSFVSVYVQDIAFHNTNLRLKDTNKHISINLKNFNLNIFRKQGFNQLFYGNGAVDFNFNIPRIFVDTPYISQVYSLSAYRVHYFGGFIKFDAVRFGSNYFSSVSNGVLYLQKNRHNVFSSPGNNSEITRLFKKISSVVSKINETTVVNFNGLPKVPKNLKIIPVIIKGNIGVKLHVAGSFSKKIRASASIHLKDIGFEGGYIKNGLVKCYGDIGNTKNKVLNFTKINLTVFNGVLKSSGYIDFAENQGKFKSMLQNIDVGKLMDFYYSEKIPQFKAIANGNVTTYLHLGKNFYATNIEKIILKKPEQQFVFKNKKGKTIISSINYGKPASVNGSVIIGSNRVVLKDIHVFSTQLNGILNGRIDYSKDYLNIKFNAAYDKLPAINFIKAVKSRYFKPSGSGIIDGSIAGRFGSVSFDFKNRFKSLYINKYTDSYTGIADVYIAPSGDVVFKKIHLEEKSHKSDKGTINFRGHIYENKILKTNYISGTLKTNNIHIFSKKMPLSLSLDLSSKCNISGKLDNPTVNIQAHAEKVYAYGQSASNIRLQALLTRNDLLIKDLAGIHDGANFRMHGQIRFKTSIGKNFNYDLQLVSNRNRLSNLKLPDKYHIKGTAYANLHIGGLFALPNISGKLVVKKIYINNYFMGNVNIGISSSKSRMILHLSALKNRLKTKVDILLKKGYPYHFVAGIDLSDTNYHKTRLSLSGGIYGSGNLSDIKNSYLFAKFDRLYLKHGRFFLKNTKSIRISYANQVLNINGFKLKGGNNDIQIGGIVTSKEYNLVINDKTDLWVLELISNKIINASGFLNGSAVIFGNRSRPKIYGFVEVKKGAAEMSVNPNYAVSRVFARFTFDDNLLVLEKAHFRLLDGFFSAHGVVKLKNFRPASYNIRSDFNSVIYRKSNYFYADMDGSIGYDGGADNGIIYGNINIKKALYDKNIELSSFLLSYKKYNVIKPATKKKAFNPKLNILIKSDKSIFIKNDFINTTFNLNAHVIGTLYHPVLIGTAGAENGDIHFRGTKFRLEYANIYFNNPYRINPTFVISANTDINQYVVRMNARGSLLNFNINFSSTPPLSELDIVSMLALGAPASSVYAGSAGSIAASEAASAIGGSVTESITGAISSYFGFKNLSVIPSYSAITHSTAPQVMVTKNITKEMSISYSNIISSQSSQSVTLTYKLSPHMSIIGVWENNELTPNHSNIYSEVGGNIVFHFRFY